METIQLILKIILKILKIVHFISTIHMNYLSRDYIQFEHTNQMLIAVSIYEEWNKNLKAAMISVFIHR